MKIGSVNADQACALNYNHWKILFFAVYFSNSSLALSKKKRLLWYICGMYETLSIWLGCTSLVVLSVHDKCIHFPVTYIFAGDVISLGDRQLTVMHMPGHSRGSICLHDREHKILFSGDVVYDGSMIDWLPYSNVSDYVVSCQRLMELVDRGLVEKVLPGHFNMFGAERLYRLASNYISKAGICHKVSTCAMRSIASIALHLTNSRGTSS